MYYLNVKQMKKFNLIIFLIFNLSVFSQIPISKKLGDFYKLKVYNLINVELIQSNENKIEITGKNAKSVYIIQKNNTLQIKMVLSKYFSGEDTFVKLYYTKINTIDVNEGATVTSQTPIKQYELELKAQEGGEITASVDTKVLTIKSVTGGKVQAYGASKSQNININTGGIYKGELLQAETSKIKIKAGGKAGVKSSESIEIKIFAGGTLTIFGKTKNIKQNNIFGGKILYKD